MWRNVRSWRKVSILQLGIKQNTIVDDREVQEATKTNNNMRKINIMKRIECST